MAVVQLYPHQVKNMIFCAQKSYAAIFDEPGCGKTLTGLELFKFLYDRGVVRNMLVIGPNSTIAVQWPSEIKKWDDFKGMRVNLLQGEPKKRRAAIPAEIYLINAEGLLWLVDLPVQYDMILVDESTLFANATTLRSRILMGLMRRCLRRYIMSGTPSAEGVEGLYSQIKLLDGGLTLGTTKTGFYEKYMVQKGFDFVARKGALQEIMALIAPFTTLTTAEEAGIPLPKLNDDVNTHVYVDMPPEAREIYNRMDFDNVVRLDHHTIVAANRGVVTQKLRQIASGCLYMPDGSTRHIHSAKTDATIQKMKEVNAAGKKAVLVVEFESDVERIERALGRPIATINGNTTRRNRAQYVQKWIWGELDEIAIHPKSAAHGLNLQGVPADVIAAGQGYSGEGDMQVIKRVHRAGQRSDVNVWRILMKNTVDGDVLDIVKRKVEGQAKAFDVLGQLTEGLEDPDNE